MTALLNAIALVSAGAVDVGTLKDVGTVAVALLGAVGAVYGVRGSRAKAIITGLERHNQVIAQNLEDEQATCERLRAEKQDAEKRASSLGGKLEIAERYSAPGALQEVRELILTVVEKAERAREVEEARVLEAVRANGQLIEHNLGETKSLSDSIDRVFSVALKASGGRRTTLFEGARAEGAFDDIAEDE